MASVTAVSSGPRKTAMAALLLGALLAALASPAFAGPLTGSCRIANQPAATLLVPYFEVDLGDPDGVSTLISINNASTKPALARVTLWTDWSVPTLSFDVYLTGFDVQTINLRDLFTAAPPTTGPGISPRGTLSVESAAFPGCTTDSNAQTATVQPPTRDLLRAAHTGHAPDPAKPAHCLGGPSPAARPNLAVGYVTIDSVNRCSGTAVGSTANTPADPQYFAKGGKGLASDNNVLWGDIIYLDRKAARADSMPALALVADPDAFGLGDYTFYGRYVDFDGRDDRAPLSSLYYARYVSGAAFSGGTDLVVWRDNRTKDATGGACGKGPAWAPLGEYQLVAFDEQENPTELPNSNAFPVATQKVHVGGGALPIQNPFGWVMLDLWHRDGTHAQGWAGVFMSTQGRYSIGHEALRADDLCNFGL